MNYELSVEDAGGPIQLLLMKGSSGRRLLGPKGSPYKEVLKTWILNESQMKQLLKDIKEVMDE